MVGAACARILGIACARILAVFDVGEFELCAQAVVNLPQLDQLLLVIDFELAQLERVLWA
jgi:hypothetical protein